MMKRKSMRMALLLTVAVTFVGVARGELVVHFPFDSDYASTAGSYVGNPLGDATISSTAAVGVGALQLDGDGDLVDLQASLPLGSDSFTWAMWVKLEDKRGDTSLCRHQLVTTSPYDPTTQLFVDRYGRLGFVATGGSGDKFSTDTVDNNQWRHVAVVANRVNNTATLYIDGMPNGGVQSCITASNLTHTGLPTLIGRHHSVSARDTHGLIDDVRFYNEALSDTQIAQLANVPEPTTLLMLLPLIVMALYKLRGHK